MDRDTKALVWPCGSCPDSMNGKMEWGCCNGGLGICEKCLDYWREKSMRGEA